MSIAWDEVRYRGDARDVQELFDLYKVSDFLVASEEVLRRQDSGTREILMTHGIRLSQNLSPRIYRLFEETCANLAMTDMVPELYLLPLPGINACAIWEPRGDETVSMVGLHPEALERLDDAELRSFMGHELGHLVFEHNRLNALSLDDENRPDKTVLPQFGENLFLRWQKKSEISADRAGLLASRDLGASARGLLKAHFGLSERNLNLDIDALLSQIESVKNNHDMMQENFSSHPLLPIRLKALQLFANSAKAARCGFPANGTQLTDEELEDQTDALMELTARRPSTALDQAVMQAVAMGGARILAADGVVGEEEVKKLVAALNLFVDDPERWVIVDARRIRKELPGCLATINQEGTEDHKRFLLSALADVALADGSLNEAETAVFMDIAEGLQLSPKFAYNVLVGIVRSSGFPRDTKLDNVASSLRESLAIGLVEQPRQRKGRWLFSRRG